MCLSRFMLINPAGDVALLATPIQVLPYSSLGLLVLLPIVSIILIIEGVGSISSDLFVSSSPLIPSFSSSSSFSSATTMVLGPSVPPTSSSSFLAAFSRLDYPVSLVVLV